MIYSTIHADCSIYPAAIQRAIQYLREHDIAKIAPGRYPIEGGQMFAVVVDVQLADIEAVKPEAHERYIDVQYWPEGATRFGVFPLSNKSNVIEAQPEHDVWYYEAEADESFLIGRPGSFAIFFPTDIHRPDLQINAPEVIRKCVVKVDISLL